MSFLRVSIFGFPPASWARKRKEICDRRRLVNLRRVTIAKVDVDIRQAAKRQNYTHISIPEIFSEEIIEKLKKQGYIIDVWKDDYGYSDSHRYVKLSVQWHEWPAV